MKPCFLFYIPNPQPLDEVMQRIREAIALCLEVRDEKAPDLEFIGIQRVTVAA